MYLESPFKLITATFDLQKKMWILIRTTQAFISDVFFEKGPHLNAVELPRKMLFLRFWWAIWFRE